MKNIYLFVVIVVLFTNCNRSKSIDIQTAKNASNYFTAVKTISKNDDGELLGFKLYAPILLFDTVNRTVYANETNEGLTPLNDLFIGELPKNILVDGSKLVWNGKKWLVVNLPLPEDKDIRNEFLIAELVRFHEANIGLDLIQVQECSYMQKKDNIYWMRMEVEALKMALISTDETEQNEHIRLALASRKMRKLMSVNMFERENNLDLKEGIPILAGILLNNLSYKESSTILYHKLDEFQKLNKVDDSFYKLILPSYGLLMSQHDTEWLKKISHQTDILNFIVDHYQFQYRESFTEMIKMITQKYHEDEFKIVTPQ